MADVIGLPGVMEQVRLVVGIRWRILRNKLRKKNNRLDVIGMAAMFVFGGGLALGASFIFYEVGDSIVSGDLSQVGWISLPFWVIFLWWQIIPAFIAGFGANFEFGSLLRFPLSLRTFYIISLAYGLANFVPIAGTLWLIAFAVGATSARPALMPALLPVCAIFFISNVTFERLLASWLDRILARRRSREIFQGIVILLAISLQFISPVLNRYGKTVAPSFLRVLPYLTPFPPSMAGRAIAAATRQQIGEFSFGIAGLLLFALFVSALLWLRLRKQYRGEELSETAAPARPRLNSKGKGIAAPEIRWPVSPQVVAVLRKEFRYLTRNSFAAVTLLSPPLFIFLISLQLGGRHPLPTQIGSATFFFPGMLAYLLLVLLAPAYNSFGYEQKGIQIFFLAPIRFRDVLLAKNLLLILVVLFEISLSIGVLAVRSGLPPTPMLAATLAAVIFNIAGQLSIANWSSVSFPRKLNFGQAAGQRQSGMVVWIMFGTQLALGGASAVVLLLGHWTGSPWLPMGIFSILCAAAIAGYFASLDTLSIIAEQKKESLIDAISA